MTLKYLNILVLSSLIQAVLEAKNWLASIFLPML